MKELQSSTQKISFERELNTAQYQAVMHGQGPLLVIAGAGSGKTRTLVYRVARLILDGVAPEQILLLTFTRKAAATMLERAAKVGGNACQRVHGGTFHAFCHRMLRKYSNLIGYPPGFTIMDQSDIQDLIHLLARQLELSGKGKRFPSKGALCNIFSKAANSGSQVDEIIEQFYPHMLEFAPGVGKLYEVYKSYKKSHALMDYDDLLLNWLRILKEFPQVTDTISNQYQYIMIDEYQDTNPTQAEIVRLMAKNHQNVMAVGDDSQSIYSFRGASFQNILDFPKIFPGTRIIKLEKNYRTTQPNLDCTNAIIANARQKFTKRLTANRQGGIPPALFIARDEEEQAKYVTTKIIKYLDQGIEPEEIAVLFRAAFHSFQLETHLGRAGIPFVKRGGMRLIDAAHIKDLLCLLRIMINPLDKISLNRILLLINKLGPKSADKIYAQLVKSQEPLDCLANIKSKASWAQEVRQLGQMLNHLANTSTSIKDLLHDLILWYKPYLESRYFDDYPKRLQELDQLIALSVNYSDAIEFLSDLALDPPENNPQPKEQGRVVLSTIHSAKGLEWRVVFMISLAEGRFPTSFAVDRPDEIEEERRLFYVAATRAKDHLHFCFPTFVNVQGAGLMPARPSRFLEEIPDKLLRIERLKSPGASRITPGVSRAGATRDKGGQTTKAHAQSSASEIKTGGAASAQGQKQSAGEFQTGDKVRHSIFGKGVVTGVLDHIRVKVLFDAVGEKTLRLDYTSLAKI